MPELWGRLQPLLSASATPKRSRQRRAQAQRPGGRPPAAAVVAVAPAAGLTWAAVAALGGAALPASAELAVAAGNVPVAEPPGLAATPTLAWDRAGALPAAAAGATCGSPPSGTGIRNGHHSWTKPSAAIPRRMAMVQLSAPAPNSRTDQSLISS